MRKKQIHISVPAGMVDEIKPKLQALVKQLTGIGEWAPEQLEYLKANYATMETQGIADHLGKELNNVRSKAYKLGLKKDSRYWSAEDEQFIADNISVLTDKEIADKLGRTRWGVINKKQKLKKEGRI